MKRQRTMYILYIGTCKMIFILWFSHVVWCDPEKSQAIWMIISLLRFEPAQKKLYFANVAYCIILNEGLHISL